MGFFNILIQHFNTNCELKRIDFYYYVITKTNLITETDDIKNELCRVGW